jgi:hypothetical protein
VQPTHGRDLRDDDDRPAATPVVVIGDTIWRRRFNADPGVLDRILRVNGVDRVIVGVMPPRVAFPEYAEFWLPLTPAASAWTRTNRSLGAVARLRSGVTIESARAEMAAIGGALAELHPEHRGWSVAVASLGTELTGETAMASVVVLGGGRARSGGRFRTPSAGRRPRAPLYGTHCAGSSSSVPSA